MLADEQARREKQERTSHEEELALRTRLADGKRQCDLQAAEIESLRARLRAAAKARPSAVPAMPATPSAWPSAPATPNTSMQSIVSDDPELRQKHKLLQGDHQDRKETWA